MKLARLFHYIALVSILLNALNDVVPMSNMSMAFILSKETIIKLLVTDPSIKPILIIDYFIRSNLIRPKRDQVKNFLENEIARVHGISTQVTIEQLIIRRENKIKNHRCL